MEAENPCPFCKLDLAGHEGFFFNHSPDDIRLHPGEANAEWQPSPEAPAIQGDKGPNRVAYVWPGGIYHLDYIGDPVVMVFDRDGLYVPCRAIRLEPHWLWLCVPIAPKNPCGEDYMREISS